MKTKHQSNNDLIISYKLLRKLIGAIGIFLPIILGIAMFFFDCENFIQDSISDYYGTQLRDVFVGFLFVLGFFLFSYKGYKTEGKGILYNDNFYANLGGVFALGVALFPTTSECSGIRAIHLTAAVLLFAVFTYFCLVIFRRGLAFSVQTKMKKVRNKFYFWCGVLIIIFVVGAGLSFFVMDEETRRDTNVIFWCETFALWVFGGSWLIKGEAFLEDKQVK
jgi:cytochrome bd-type quinol oxidase subunit 2